MCKEKECPIFQTYIHICVSNKISKVYAMKDWHLLCGEEGVGGEGWWGRSVRKTSSLQYQYSGGHGGEQQGHDTGCYVCILCTFYFFLSFFFFLFFFFFFFFNGVG